MNHVLIEYHMYLLQRNVSEIQTNIFKRKYNIFETFIKTNSSNTSYMLSTHWVLLVILSKPYNLSRKINHSHDRSNQFEKIHSQKKSYNL